MTLALAIRTADRKPCYLAKTVTALLEQGVSPRDLHVFPTAPDVAWLEKALPGVPLCLHVPATVRNPNENGRAMVSVLDEVQADWLLMLEDDLQFCANFVESASRWLEAHQRKDVHVYRFCAFGAVVKTGQTWQQYHLREQRGSQAVALRAADARDFAAWAAEKRECWRPAMAPFQNQRTNGFDKLVGYWAIDRFKDRIGLVSRPQFVKHIGLTSSLHRERPSIHNSGFAGAGWTYQEAVHG